MATGVAPAPLPHVKVGDGGIKYGAGTGSTTHMAASTSRKPPTSPLAPTVMRAPTCSLSLSSPAMECTPATSSSPSPRAAEGGQRSKKRKSPSTSSVIFRSPLSRILLSPRMHLPGRVRSPSMSRGSPSTAPSVGRSVLVEIDLNAASWDLNAEPEEDGEALGQADGQAVVEALGQAVVEALGQADGQVIGEALGQTDGQVIGEALGQVVDEALGQADGEGNARRKDIAPNDRLFCEAAKQDGFDIRLICQPTNSPDFNILDLRFFSSIQSIQYKTTSKTTTELVEAVDKAFRDYSVAKANRIFLTLHGCLKEVMKIGGGNGYDTPHIKKEMLERQGHLPLQLGCDVSLVDEVRARIAE